MSRAHYQSPRGACGKVSLLSARGILAVLVVFAAMLLAPSAASAWKPFAHNYTGDQAYVDAVDDGSVMLDGHSYPLDSRLVSALRSKREFYNAGVVGPDGFPDLVYGQSQIHPVHTGKWLRYLVDEAWAAQADSRYDADERAQILAFTYGFLTHAAGDMWGHTLVNDFAGGVFPSVGELANADKAKIALRHLIVEGYVGGATPGWDRSTDQEDRASVCTPPGPPATDCNDVSEDQTHGIPYDAPHKFLYNTLVDPRVPLPVGRCSDGVDDDHDGAVDDGCPGHSFTVGKPEPQRGQLLDHFLDLQANLKVTAAELRKDAERTDCLDQPGNCVIEHPDVGPINTVRGIKTDSTVTWRVCHSDICFDDPSDLLKDKLNLLIADYLDAWIDDIEVGLHTWSEFSLGVTKALFDPQARRDAQNAECHTFGPEASLPRANCESRVGALDTITFKTNDYVNNHMLSMLGLPDLAGPLREALQQLSDLLDTIVGPLLNPVRLVEAGLREAIKTMIKDAIRRATGVDVEEVKGFLTHPTRWMCGDAGVSITLPGAGTITGAGLFSAAEHARIDALAGLKADHHETGTTISTDCSPLTDDADYSPNDFAAIKDTITQAKLLLLDGTQLNRALGDVLAERGVIKSASLVHTYAPEDNVMITSLGTTQTPPWLELIDSDHAWRQDGLPRFCNSATTCSPLPGDLTSQLADYPRQPTPRDTNPEPADPNSPELLNGGTGNYPIWESCVLRPAFRELYADWENNAHHQQTRFPDLGDATSPDPKTDDKPPTVQLAFTGTTFKSGGTTFVSRNVDITATAHDDVFADGYLKLQYRTHRSDTPAGDFKPLENGGSFTLPGDTPDGVWVVEVRAADGCDSQVHTETVTVDQDAPQITIASPSPEGVIVDTATMSEIQFSADDSPRGSGIKASSVTLDGKPATNGDKLDAFLLTPGVHTIVATATDNLDNKAAETRHFEVHATSESLRKNVDRACNDGLITSRLMCQTLATWADLAVSAHELGAHMAEAGMLRGFINELEILPGNDVDPATAARLVAFARDLIQREI